MRLPCSLRATQNTTWHRCVQSHSNTTKHETPQAAVPLSWWVSNTRPRDRKAQWMVPAVTEGWVTLSIENTWFKISKVKRRLPAALESLSLPFCSPQTMSKMPALPARCQDGWRGDLQVMESRRRSVMGQGGRSYVICRGCTAPGMSAIETKLCLLEHCLTSSLWTLDLLQPTLTKITFWRRDLAICCQITVCDGMVWVSFEELNCHNGMGFRATCGDLICA